jgi:hypothetical protein
MIKFNSWNYISGFIINILKATNGPKFQQLGQIPQSAPTGFLYAHREPKVCQQNKLPMGDI